MMKRYKYLLETLLFVFVVVAFGYYNGNPAFVGVTNHPFFLIILMISVRYGYLRGTVATTILAVAYLGFSYLTGKTPVSLESTWGHLRQPFFFYAFAMFVGLLVEIDKKKIQKTNALLLKYTDKISQKSTEITKILSINENISNQLTTVDQSFNVVFHNTKSFYDEDIMAVYRTAYDLLIKTVKATSAFIYILEGNRFKPFLPKEEEKEAGELIQTNHEAIEEIKNTQSFFRLDSTPFVSESTPVYIGAVFHEKSGNLYGLMVVKDIDFMNYNESSFITFKNLCKWLGAVLYFRSHKAESIIPGDESAATFNYLVAYGASKNMIHQKISGLFEDDEKY